jgi:hypothetical protein
MFMQVRTLVIDGGLLRPRSNQGWTWAEGGATFRLQPDEWAYGADPGPLPPPPEPPPPPPSA